MECLPEEYEGLGLLLEPVCFKSQVSLCMYKLSSREADMRDPWAFLVSESKLINEIQAQ